MLDSKRNASDPSAISKSSEDAKIRSGNAKIDKKDAEVGKSPAADLSPEEQMALYEADLKEHDWGHQPC